ncbi:MAG: hypothetical protein ACRC9X_08230 [Bacteroidales bacterium]
MLQHYSKVVAFFFAHSQQSPSASLQEQFAQTTKTLCKSTGAWFFPYFLLVIAGLTRNPPPRSTNKKKPPSID